MILRHAYLENREFESCPAEPASGSPALRNVITVLYNLFSLFNPLQVRGPLPVSSPDQLHRGPSWTP